MWENGSRHDGENVYINPGDVALYYSVGYDVGLGRTLSDSFSAYGIAEQMGIRPSYVNRIGNAIRWATLGFTSIHMRQRTSAVYLVSLVPTWNSEIHSLLSAITSCNSRIRNLILRRDCLSVALVTLNWQPDKAHDFWRGVANDDGLGKNHPSRLLRGKLFDSLADANRRIPLSMPYMSRYAAAAWNNYMANKESKISVTCKDGEPIRIDGTGYKGTQPLEAPVMRKEGNISTPNIFQFNPLSQTA